MKKLSRALAVLLIIAATFLVYWPALRNGFVWDDTALVLRDPLIRSWTLIPEGLRHFLFLDATASNFYRPIQRLTFVADYQFFGFGWPGGWHLTSIAIHAAAAVALFFAAGRILKLAARNRLSEAARHGWALAIALLWAIHPLHTSAVTYVAGRADPLAAFFGFIALTLGLISLERKTGWWRIGAAAGFALALLSKESGVTFLLVWILVLVWQRVDRRTVVTWAALIAIVLGGYSSLRLTAHKTPPPPPPVTPASVRPILAARAFAEYAALIIAPTNLRMERDVSTKPRETYEATMQNARLREYQTLGGILLLVGFAAWIGVCWRRAPGAAFCLGAFALAYLPISNVFSLNATLAEHWLYVPSAFLFLAVALSLISFVPAGLTPAMRIALSAAGLGWVLLLAGRTYLRQGDWRDQRTFVERNISAGGDSPRMLMNLANVESNAGQHEEAVQLYRKALQISPDQPIFWLGYASILARAGDVNGARDALTRAESSPLLRPDCLQLQATLAGHDGQGDPKAILEQAAAFAPDNWALKKRLTEVRIARGEIKEGLHELTEFIATHPFRSESWKMLGRVLEGAGQLPQARTAYAEAMRRDIRDTAVEADWQRLSGMARP